MSDDRGEAAMPPGVGIENFGQLTGGDQVGRLPGCPESVSITGSAGAFVTSAAGGR